MDLGFSSEEQSFREEVRAFCKARLPERIRRKLVLQQRLKYEDYAEWQRILDDQGWAVPHWPAEWGGKGWSAMRLYIFNEELQQFPAPPPDMHNGSLLGPVLMAFGTDEQKQHFLPKLRRLDYWFCQGLSEPGSGSDLASLKTRAVRDGDNYIVNGQKLWTSYGHASNWMFALVRTDPEAQKQKGISYLLIDMKSPGITVRPIITLGSEHQVNEVFFDNVKVPVANRIGEENKGWGIGKHSLGNERVNLGRVGLSKHRVRFAKGLMQQVADGDKTLADNVRLREKVAMIEIELKAIEITQMRVVSDMEKNNKNRADPKASILKLKGTELQQATQELLLEIAGPFSVPQQTAFYCQGGAKELEGPDWAATVAPGYFFARSRSITGGSNEIQHNIIAKAILGL